MDGFLFEYPWHPKIVDTQILQIGNILIVAIPGEITTMAGRFVIQISNTVRASLQPAVCTLFTLFLKFTYVL